MAESHHASLRYRGR